MVFVSVKMRVMKSQWCLYQWPSLWISMVFARRGVTIHFHPLNWLNYEKWCLLVSVHHRLVVVVVVDGLLCCHSHSALVRRRR
jgi:hypothetical protein